METKKMVQVFYGTGKGKTTAAMGQGIREVGLGHKVIIIQFLKGKDNDRLNYLERFEPEIKLFRFEKETEVFRDLTDEEQKEEIQNILNGFHFARKVLETGECDVLILDEVLGLLDYDIITTDDLRELIRLRDEECKVILTGMNFPEEMMDDVDLVSEITQIKG